MTGAPVVDGFSHEAFLYDDLEEFLNEVCGFVRTGLDQDEAVLVATGGERLGALRAFFGDETGVQLLDMPEVGANPARIIPIWREFLDTNSAAGRSVRGVGEPIWAGRSEAELAECHQHESLLNLAFGSGPAWRLLCPYDVSALPEPVIDEARANHPRILSRNAWKVSDRYHPKRPGRSLRDRPLPPPVGTPVELQFAAGDLGAVRRLVARQCAGLGIAAEASDDMVLCADELVTNSLVHGGGSGVLRLWREDATLVCEVADSGTIADPMVGREAPSPQRLGGRGIWLANQLCDLVQVRSGPGGTVVRLHTRIA